MAPGLEKKEMINKYFVDLMSNSALLSKESHNISKSVTYILKKANSNQVNLVFRCYLTDIQMTISTYIFGWERVIKPRPLPPSQHHAPMPCTDTIHGAASPSTR